MKKILPESNCQFLCGELDEGWFNKMAADKIDVDIHYPTLMGHPDYMESFKKRGIKVNCWTCDSPENGEKLAEMGVDFITSNILE